MSDKFDIQQVDSTKLYLIWYLYHMAKKNGFSKEYGEPFYHYPDISWDCLPTCRYSDAILEALDELKNEGFIATIGIQELDLSDDDKWETGSLFCLSDKKPKQLWSGAKHCKTLKDVEFESESFGIITDLNTELANDYILEYISKWQNDELYFYDKNIYRREKQVEEVAKAIFEVIEKHSHKFMLLTDHSGWLGMQPIDFFATVLFLERTGDLIIHEAYGEAAEKAGESSTSGFRVSLTEKFFRDFSLVKDGVQFDFEALANSDSNEMPPLTFEAPYRIYGVNNEEYRLNQGGIPFELMNMAFADVTVRSVNMEALKEKTSSRNLQAIKKNIENFRNTLRERFNLSAEGDQIIEIRDGEILINPRIFQKKKKIVQI